MGDLNRLQSHGLSEQRSASTTACNAPMAQNSLRNCFAVCEVFTALSWASELQPYYTTGDKPLPCSRYGTRAGVLPEWRGASRDSSGLSS